jgi:hypothetical protein
MAHPNIVGRRWIILLAAFGLGACGGDDQDEAGAAELWQRIHAEDYRNWERAPGWETEQPTVSAHGHTALIFINATMSDARLDTDRSAWPDAALLVKDSYRDGALALIAVIEKRAAGWYFAEWDGEGTLKFAGSPSVCKNCHDQAYDTVFSVPLP